MSLAVIHKAIRQSLIYSKAFHLAGQLLRWPDEFIVQSTKEE